MTPERAKAVALWLRKRWRADLRRWNDGGDYWRGLAAQRISRATYDMFCRRHELNQERKAE